MICLLWAMSLRSYASSACYVAQFVMNRRNVLYSFAEILYLLYVTAWFSKTTHVCCIMGYFCTEVVLWSGLSRV